MIVSGAPTPQPNAPRTSHAAAAGGSAAMEHEHTRAPANAQLLGSMEEAVPWMLDRIAEAKHSVVLNQYILESRGVGKQVMEAAAASGVDVKIIADAEGSFARPFMKNHKALTELTKQYPNVQVEIWDKPISPWATGILHDKSFSIDGGTAAAVGSGGLGPTNAKWGEEFIALQGAPARDVFAEQSALWVQAGGKLSEFDTAALAKADEQDAGVPASDVGTKVVANRPGVQLAATRELFRAINNAKERIWLKTPFLASENLARALVTAKEKNPELDVRVMVAGGKGGSVVPGFNLLPRTYYEDLVRGGVQVLETSKPIHIKSSLIDGEYQSGSMNHTWRAQVADNELNVTSNEPQLLEQAEAVWERDASTSRVVDLADLDSVAQNILDGPIGKIVQKVMGGVS